MRVSRAARPERPYALDDPRVREGVRAILQAVRAGGDTALIDHVRRLDLGGADPPPLRVTGAELEEALAALDPDVRAGLELAAANVKTLALAGLRAEQSVTMAQGHEVVLREHPVARAAIYVPGGRAPYPSTVVMGVVTARVAGVEEVVVSAPGGHPSILAACALTGASEVYRMGGAHAVAALAYGTESVRAVQVIAGPGNQWVQEAKRQVYGHVGIDGFAGPSDVVVIAAADADPALVAADLRAQAEHGEGTVVAAISPDEALLAQVEQALAAAPETGASVQLIAVSDIERALALAEEFAPEHLELVGAEAEALAPRVRSAGCLFVGPAGGTAFGDYVAGSNHVLPTQGAARFASGLGVAHFRRRMSEVRIDARAAAALAAAGAAVARAEGFEWHAASMEARVGENEET